MSTRYITGGLFAILGSFLIVVSQTLASAVLGWVAFGVTAGIIAVCVLAQLDRSRGIVRRTLDRATVAIATLMLVSDLAASGGAVRSLSFAFALGIVTLAFADLPRHEVSNWRTPLQRCTTDAGSPTAPSSPPPTPAPPDHRQPSPPAGRKKWPRPAPTTQSKTNERRRCTDLVPS